MPYFHPLLLIALKYAWQCHCDNYHVQFIYVLLHVDFIYVRTLTTAWKWLILRKPLLLNVGKTYYKA